MGMSGNRNVALRPMVRLCLKFRTLRFLVIQEALGAFGLQRAAPSAQSNEPQLVGPRPKRIGQLKDAIVSFVKMC
jgi:hypothetical protein